jgi:uncharacterized protein YndB with AHSA1/START domain
MATELRTSTSVTLHATPNAVWRALTTPDQIRQWFFGVETRTDWQVGGPIVHSGEWQGQPYEDKGTIVEFDPARRLVHTHWSPLSGLPDAPENYQVVAWELEERDGPTVLTVSEESLPSEQAKATSETAWATVLENLRRLLESS